MSVQAKYQRMIQRVRQNHRVLAYSALVLVGSLLSLPEDYKIDKRNILNQWFVKIGWFWTNALLLPLLFATIRMDDRETVAQAIFRLVASSTLWYTSVNIFQFVDTTTGFDISGHTFLLMFSNLFITSELKLTDTQIVVAGDENQTKKKSSSITNLQAQTSRIKLSLVILSALWDFMLLQTTLYYHTIIQKAIAAIWAILSWYIMDIVFYQKVDKIHYRSL